MSGTGGPGQDEGVAPGTVQARPAPADGTRALSAARRGAYLVARHLFPPRAGRSVPVRRALLKHTLHHLERAVAGTPVEGRLWLMGGLAIGYARSREALRNDLVDVDLGYADADHDALMATLEALRAEGFVPVHRLVSNAGVPTACRLRHDGVWIDLLRCFRRDEREYWITYLTDRRDRAAPREVEVETEVTYQAKVATEPLYGTRWLCAGDLDRYLREQYGDWDVPDDVFYGRQWDHVRDSPAVVRCEPWTGRWEPWR